MFIDFFLFIIKRVLNVYIKIFLAFLYLIKCKNDDFVTRAKFRKFTAKMISYFRFINLPVYTVYDGKNVEKTVSQSKKFAHLVTGLSKHLQSFFHFFPKNAFYGFVIVKVFF